MSAQEPDIQELVCRALGRPLAEVTPAEIVDFVRRLDARPWWLVAVASMLVEDVARQLHGRDERAVELARTAAAAAFDLGRDLAAGDEGDAA